MLETEQQIQTRTRLDATRIAVVPKKVWFQLRPDPRHLRETQTGEKEGPRGRNAIPLTQFDCGDLFESGDGSVA